MIRRGIYDKRGKNIDDKKLKKLNVDQLLVELKLHGVETWPELDVDEDVLLRQLKGEWKFKWDDTTLSVDTCTSWIWTPCF